VEISRFVVSRFWSSGQGACVLLVVLRSSVQEVMAGSRKLMLYCVVRVTGSGVVVLIVNSGCIRKLGELWLAVEDL
jgi:hypothetical protein